MSREKCDILSTWGVDLMLMILKFFLSAVYTASSHGLKLDNFFVLQSLYAYVSNLLEIMSKDKYIVLCL